MFKGQPKYNSRSVSAKRPLCSKVSQSIIGVLAVSRLTQGRQTYGRTDRDRYGDRDRDRDRDRVAYSQFFFNFSDEVVGNVGLNHDQQDDKKPDR